MAHPLHRAGAQPRGKILRPNLGVPAGLAGARGEGPRSASDRREEEAHSARVKEKMKQYPDLFKPKRVLGPPKTTLPPAHASCGQTLLHDRVVTTAVIVTDPLVAKYDALSSSERKGRAAAAAVEREGERGGGGGGGEEEEEKVLGATVRKRLSLISQRHSRIRALLAQLPLAYEEWPSVLSGQCPAAFMSQGPFSHKATERGLGMAHHQIWRDWAFRHREATLATMSGDELRLLGGGGGRGGRAGTAIDADPRCELAAAPGQLPAERRDGEQIGSSSSSSKYARTLQQHDRDLLLVLEDDAALADGLAAAAAGRLLLRELDNLHTDKVDVLFLGWCYGKGLRAMPMCAHAYVLTRRGAALLLEHWEPCGLAVDAQWHALERRGLLRWARAHAESFNGTAEFSFLSDQNNGDGQAQAQAQTQRQRQRQSGTKSSGGGGSGSSSSDDQQFFRGMFKQGNLGSFNDHLWMPNANADADADAAAASSE